MDLVIGGISALAALIGAMWGIVKYYDQKRTKQEENQRTKERERDEQLDNIKFSLDAVKTTIDENEMDRLRSEIIQAENDLRNGLELSEVYLKHVHHSYDKYISKGGNSYIVECMDNIKEYERECRAANIIGFEHRNEE